MMGWSDLLLAGRWLLAIVLVAAGIAKATAGDRASLTGAIRNYGVVPSGLVDVVAAALPWMEIVIGGSLCAGVRLVITASCAALAFATFAVVISWHLIRGHRFECGCAGTDAEIGWSLVARDLLLCGLAVAIAFGPSGGLAAWAGWGAHPAGESLESMVPVPLIVLALIVSLKLVMRLRLPAGILDALKFGRPVT